MRHATLLDHEARLLEAIRFIHDHLDEPASLQNLADQVSLSRFHFHRVFVGLLGETPADMSRRLRLERSAKLLRQTSLPISEIAFGAGYSTHEAYVRAFRAAYGYSPSTFRRRIDYEGELPTQNGIHFDSLDDGRFRFVKSQGAILMEVEFQDLEPRRALCMTHTGPYYMIGTVFGRLAEWCARNGIPISECLGIFYDDPETTPTEQLRSDAGTYVPNDFAIDDPEVHVVDIPGGRYAVTTHMGPYDGLGQTWAKFGGEWFPNSGHEMAEGPSFEIYRNDCQKVSPAEVRTDLFIRIK